MTTTTRRIYVACLASYNAGILHGVWIETEGLDEDELSQEVREKVLLTSPEPNVMVTCPDCEGSGKDIPGESDCPRCHGKGEVPSSEEYAIHDHEGFPSGLIGEYTPLSEIAKIEEVLGELDSDEEIEAFMIYVNDCQSGDMKDVTVEKFRDAYRGQYDSPKAFAEEWAIETGLITDDHPMFSYIDFEDYWNGDLRHNGFYEEKGHIFLCD
jgi:antirestriction protein